MRARLVPHLSLQQPSATAERVGQELVPGRWRSISDVDGSNVEIVGVRVLPLLGGKAVA